MPDADPLARYKLGLEYFKALAWPVLVVALLVVYRPPLGRMVQAFAAKFEQASKLSIGSLSVEVAEKAREVGNAELAKSIGELSAGAIQELMRTPRNGSMRLLSTMERDNPQELGMPAQRDLDALLELERKKLIKFDEPLTTFLSYARRVGTPRSADAQARDENHDWLVVDPSRADTARLLGQGYELTEQGRLAAEAITRAVASQLAGQS